MSSTPAAAPATTAKPKAKSVATKVQDHIDMLQGRIDALSKQNALLKSELQQARSSNSRIRRIPKRATESEPAATQTAA